MTDNNSKAWLAETKFVPAWQSWVEFIFSGHWLDADFDCQGAYFLYTAKFSTIPLPQSAVIVEHYNLQLVKYYARR